MLFLLVILILRFNSGLGKETELRMINTLSCVCPDYETIFECVITGGTATIWQGTALDECENGNVILRHSQFDSGWVLNKTCGITGLVVGKTISGGNYSNTFTSQLIISNFSKDLYGSTIECTSDSDLVSNNSQIILSKDSVLHPSNVFLSDVIGGEILTFQWSSVLTDCPVVFYKVNASDCSNCTDVLTSSNSIICNISLCLLQMPKYEVSVQPVVCDDVFGAINTITVQLTKVVDTPSLMITKAFSSITLIQTKFNKTESFYIISGRIDGSASNYTITYSDALSGNSCGLATIPATSCSLSDDVCNHVLDVTSSTCYNSTNISVTVFASNILGDGPASYPVFAIINIQLLHNKSGEDDSFNYECLENTSLLNIGLGASLIVSCLVAITLIAIVIVLIKGKRNLQTKLTFLRDQKVNIIYDEVKTIRNKPSKSFEVQKNSAYGCAQRVCT